MTDIKIRGVRVRFDSEENVALSAADLKKSSDSTLREIAAADRAGTRGGVSAAGDGNRWVTEDELARATGLSASVEFEYNDIANTARRAHFSQQLISTLRAQRARPARPPKPLKLSERRLAELPRSAYVPLAEYVAARFVDAKSYLPSIGDPAARIYHFDGSDIVKRYSQHELRAALAILTAREGGCEFGLVRDEDGHHHFVQGSADRVELDSVDTGFDLIFHTHPRNGARMAAPSPPDLAMARRYDPDQQAGVVSQDGWSSDYRATPGSNAEQPPHRLWNARG